MKAKFVGSVRDRNGYAETLCEKHEQEQKRIDDAIAEQEKPKTEETFDLSVLDLLYQED